MATPILMPALSPTMTEGTISKWLKAEGDAIQSGDLLAEIETDKATMELEAIEEGILGKIIQPEGSEGIPVNEPIAVVLLEGEDAAAADSVTAGDTAQKPMPSPTPSSCDRSKLLHGKQQHLRVKPSHQTREGVFLLVPWPSGSPQKRG